MSPKLLVQARPEGPPVEVVGTVGMSLMEAIREHGFDELLALCGGCCSCSTCHVFVAHEFLDRLPPMSAQEDELLEGAANRRPESRLSCQIPVVEALDGLRVEIAPNE